MVGVEPHWEKESATSTNFKFHPVKQQPKLVLSFDKQVNRKPIESLGAATCNEQRFASTQHSSFCGSNHQWDLGKYATRASES